MKLLFEHNLSYKLVGRLADLFPHAAHVRDVNMHAADDRTVWEYARANGFAIVSKDEDFHQLSFLYGAPPKVVSETRVRGVAIASDMAAEERVLVFFATVADGGVCVMIPEAAAVNAKRDAFDLPTGTGAEID